MVKNPPLDNFPCNCIPLTLMSLHNAPALLVGSPVSHHHKYRKSGGGSALPSRREPFRFSVAVLLREPRVGWCELTSQPVDESERDRKVFSHLTRSPSWTGPKCEADGACNPLLVMRPAWSASQPPLCSHRCRSGGGGGGGGGAHCLCCASLPSTIDARGIFCNSTTRPWTTDYAIQQCSHCLAWMTAEHLGNDLWSLRRPSHRRHPVQGGPPR